MMDGDIKRLIGQLRQRSRTVSPSIFGRARSAPDLDCRAAANMLEQYLDTKQEYRDFQQEVSDAVEQADLLDLHGTEDAYKKLHRFIIAKPDPWVGIFAEIFAGSDIAKSGGYWNIQRKLRAALEARGLEIREKGQ
jgi:hypothetical protein